MKSSILLIFLFGFFNFVVGQSTLTDSLQCYYPFNGNANDASGNGNDAFVEGASLTTDRYGIDSSAYKFDGIDDFISSSSTFDYQKRSVALWVQPYDVSGINPHNHVAITQDDYRLNYGLFRVDFDQDMVKLWAGGIHNIYFIEAEKYVDKWLFFVLIRDSDSVRYYINAALVYADNANNYGSSYMPDSTFVIGSGRTRDAQFFHGKIDDIRIYNRVLTENEIVELFMLLTPDDHHTFKEFKIYPNPSTNKIYIDYPIINTTDYQLSIIDITGRTVYTGECRQSFDVSFLTSSIYFVKLTNKEGKEFLIEKFVKK